MERRRPGAEPTGEGPTGEGPTGGEPTGEDPADAKPTGKGQAGEGPAGARPEGRPLAGGLLSPQPDPAAALTAALTRALFEEWARTGYAALSLEAVARRAGTTRATLMRRWPSKAAMVVERVESLGIDLVMAPDTGTLQGDLRAVLQALRRLLRHPLVRRILPDLHAELQRSPALASALSERLRTVARMRSATLAHRAAARGELGAAIDIDLVTDSLCGILYWRLVASGGRADHAYLDRLAAFLAAAMQASAPPDRRPRRRRIR